MIDVCKYEKIGEYHDGRMIWLSPKKENIVYLIMFGDESYIGSSKNIHRRISQYLPALKRGKYDADRVQQAFDKNKGFDLYAIEFSDFESLRERERFYINTLNPTLNTRTSVSSSYREKDTNSFKCRIKKENLKGLQTSITISEYNRLIRLRSLRSKSIQELVEEAIAFWLDVQDGKIKIE